MSPDGDSTSLSFPKHVSDEGRISGGTKIIHVVDNIEPGGAQHILIALASADPDAVICALHAKPGENYLTRAVDRVEVLASGRLSVVAILWRLTRLVLRNRANAIFNAHLEASTIFLCLLRRAIGFRLIVTVHATQAQWPGWFRAVFRRVIFYADHVIADSHRVYKETHALGIPADRLTVIPIGTLRLPKPAGLPASDIRSEFGIEPGVPVFLNIARMVPGKGQIDLVRAMTEVPEAVAVIVGFGPEEGRLRDEVRKLGLGKRVIFAGMRTDLDGFYAAASAFVMPCLDESMGIVIYDALTFQVPVIAYESGGIGEIVADGRNGYLLQRDPHALAEGLRRILRNETTFEFRPPIEYSAATMVERHRALCDGLARKWFGNASRENET